MQQVRPEETVLDLHGREYYETGVLIVSPETRPKLLGRSKKVPSLKVRLRIFFRALSCVGDHFPSGFLLSEQKK